MTPPTTAECTGRLIITGPSGVRVVDLGSAETIIGRASACARIMLDSAEVSRRHASLESIAGGGHRIVDLDSTNGTLVNDVRVRSAVLGLYDRVRVGDHVLVYLDPETPADRVMRLVGLTCQAASSSCCATERKRKSGP